MKQIENENMKVTYTEERIKNLMRRLAENESKYSHKEVKADLQEQMRQLEKRIADLEGQVQSQLKNLNTETREFMTCCKCHRFLGGNNIGTYAGREGEVVG